MITVLTIAFVVSMFIMIARAAYEITVKVR
jgi:hypothetical protein